jgi:hypothetical protein
MTCLVYCCCVFVVILRVAQKMNNHTWISTLFLVLSPLMFFAQFWYESFFDAANTNGNLYHLFESFVRSPETYLVVGFISWTNFSQFMVFG